MVSNLSRVPAQEEEFQSFILISHSEHQMTWPMLIFANLQEEDICRPDSFFSAAVTAVTSGVNIFSIFGQQNIWFVPDIPPNLMKNAVLSPKDHPRFFTV